MVFQRNKVIFNRPANLITIRNKFDATYQVGRRFEINSGGNVKIGFNCVLYRRLFQIMLDKQEAYVLSCLFLYLLYHNDSQVINSTLDSPFLQFYVDDGVSSCVNPLGLDTS